MLWVFIQFFFPSLVVDVVRCRAAAAVVVVVAFL